MNDTQAILVLLNSKELTGQTIVEAWRSQYDLHDEQGYQNLLDAVEAFQTALGSIQTYRSWSSS